MSESLTSKERADRLDANVSLFALDKYASDTRPADIEFREVHELCKEIERLTHENARLQSIVTLRERATDEPAAPLDLRRYFKVSPVAVQGEPDACRLDFHVGVQTIPIGPEYCETAEHAEWWINVICKALQNVISAASRPAEPPVDIRPIETAPKDELALFWIVAKTAEESYTDTSGNPIVALSYTPHWELTKLGRWSSLLKATHWSPLPGAPSTKSAVCEHDLQKPSHTVWVSDSGKVARCSACGQQWSPVETSERCDRPPPHNPGIPPTPRCRLLKGHEGPCDYPF